MRVRRLVAGTAATGLLAGGAAFGMATTANAAPAPSSVSTVAVADHHGHHDKCTWAKGHWEKRWVKGHWEKRQVHHKTWHHGHHDKHGTWHQGSWEHHYTYKWVYVPGHWDHHWVKGHWDCKHH
jgi:hypothetical protein